MREIKFRGKHLNKWLYGSLHVNESGQPAIATPSAFHFRCVDPETVGQKTGFRDSEGKEIFEGDVLEYKTWAETGERYVTMGEVRFVQDQFLVVGPKDIVVQGLFGVAHEPALSELLVLGNIHDNPSLLEEAAHDQGV